MRLLPFVLLATCSLASAQVGPAPRVRMKQLPAPQPNLLREAPPENGRQNQLGARPAILLTGYWPQTNEMLRAFSNNPTQNPNGWIGSNWEGRGYDIYSYFPEFPFSVGQGVGDLEVDYQDTTADFWPIADGVDPIALITFSRGFIDDSWEVEYNQRNLTSWIDDYTAPFQPTPSPPDASVPADHIRISTLPVQEIVDFVELMDLNVEPYVNFTGFGGGFLSEFIAYLGVWYQSLHADPTLPDWCVAGGHVHVGALNSLLTCKRASKATLRRLIHYVDGALDAEVGEAEFFCSPNASGVGIGAQLTMTGSMSIARNDLELIVTHAPEGEFGLLFYGANQQAPAPLGDGNLCIAGTLYRVLPAAQVGATGLLNLPLDLGAPPFASGPGAIAAGSSVYFQFWYRDGTSTGAGSNTSSALGLAFLP